MFNSRNKGSAGEREVAKLLESWWSVLEPGVKFVKTPLSGGWGTPTLRSEFKTSGDLVTTAKSFPFTIEVKRREAWTLERLLLGSKSPVWGWWKQANAQAVEMSSTPLLWIRKNRHDWRILLPWQLVPTLRSAGFDKPIHEWAPWTLEPHELPMEPVMVMASDFLELPPSIFATSKKSGKKPRKERTHGTAEIE